MNYIAAYNEQLNSGKIVASRRVKSVYARLAAATKNQSGQYFFDEARAERPITFIERFCKHSIEPFCSGFSVFGERGN